MTVNLETPYESWSGRNLRYAFTWTCDDKDDVVVRVDGVEEPRNGLWYLDDFDPDSGGTVVFHEIPDVQVEVFRRTPITQQVDYTEFERFPAETHESLMDKLTRILQEFIVGGRAFGGPVNLEADAQPDRVDIVNSQGTDATIPIWEVDGTGAGVFAGAVVDVAPADGDPTGKPNGFMWLQIEADAPPPAWGGVLTPIAYELNVPASDIGYRTTRLDLDPTGVDKLTATPGSAHANFIRAVGKLLESEQIVNVAVSALEQVWWRLDVLEIDDEVFTQFSIPEGEWVDAYFYIDLGASNPVRENFFQNRSQIAGVGYSVMLTIAPDDGAGAPDETQALTRTYTVNWT